MAFFNNLLTVSAGTTVTRCLGFLRDMLVAAVLGTGPIADAFVIAFRLPNIVRRVFGEGAFNAAFIPLYLRMNPAEGLRFTGLVQTVFLGFIVVLSLFLMLAMPWLMPFFAPGFVAGEQFDLTVTLTRLAFPFLPFMAIMALYGALLNAHNHFVATSYAPALLNIVLLVILIPAAWLGAKASPQLGEYLAIGIAVAGFLQAALLVFAARSYHIPFVKPSFTPRLQLLFWRSIPSLITAGIAQINILVGTIIATYQFSGVAWLYYADRLYQLPLGIIGIALGVVLLNDLTQAKTKNDTALFADLQKQALILSLILALPATLGLFMGAQGIMSVLFERGAFLAKDSFEAARALQGFAVGLPAFILVKIYANSYFAEEEMGAPFRASLFGLSVNVILCLLLFKPFGVMGIALATSLSGYVTCGFLLFPLVRRGDLTLERDTVFKLTYVFLAVLGMALCLMMLKPLLAKPTFITLALFVGGGLMSYGLLLAFFHRFCLKLVQFKGLTE